MSISIDPDRLLREIGISLATTVLPELTSPVGRRVGDCAFRLVLREKLRQAAGVASSTADAARQRADEIQALAADGSPSAGQRLADLLEEDSRSYREQAQALDAEVGRVMAERDSYFKPPTEAELTDYLRARFPADPAIQARNLVWAVGGYSKQTVLFDMVGGDGSVQELVMRRNIPDNNVDTTVVNEFAVLKAVHAQGFPVAEPLWLETGSPVVPQPFLVSRRMPGSVKGDPLGLRQEIDFDPGRALADLLARLHRIDVDALDLPGYSDIVFDAALQRRRLDYWTADYASAGGPPVATMEIAFQWLRANAHLGLQPKVLVHGEIGFHNILFHDGKATALLDWELTHAGSAAEDLAYVKPFVEPLGAFDDFLAMYARAGGRVPPVTALEYYEVFANLRNAILGVKGIAFFNSGRLGNLMMLEICAITVPIYIEKLRVLLGRIMRERGFVQAEEASR